MEILFFVLNAILFFKVWKMCNNVADMKERFKTFCPTVEEKIAMEKMVMDLMKKQHKTLNSESEVSNTESLKVGDIVIYEPMNKRMMIKEITDEGMLFCVSYSNNGINEKDGPYKPEQVRKI